MMLMTDNGIRGKLLWANLCGNEAYDYTAGSPPLAAGGLHADLIQDNYYFLQDIFIAGAWKESLHPSESAS